MKPNSLTKKKGKIETDLELFRDLINKSNDAIFVNDPQTGFFVFVNDRACTGLGYNRQELLKMNVMDIEAIFPDNFSWQTHVDELRQKGSHILEGIHKRKDGTTFPVEINVSYIVLSPREYMVAVVRDISERKKVEENLRKSKEQLHAYLNNISDTIWLIDADLNMVYVSPSVKRMLDISPEELIGNPSALIIHQDDMDVVIRAQRYVMEHPGEPHTIRYRVSHKNGSWLHVESTGVNMMANPAINGVLVTMRNITESRIAEERNDRLLKAISAVSEGIAITDEKDRFIYVNDAYARMYGYLQYELIGKTWRDTVTPEMVPLIEISLSKTLHNRAVGIWGGECPALRKDGVILPTEVTATARWDGMDNYLGHICIIRDITERKRTEEALINKERFIRNILDTVDEGFIVIDREFRILTANKAYCRQTGASCDSAIGLHCYEISHKTLRPCYEEGEECAVRHVFETGEPHAALHKHPDAKGSILYVETKAFPIKDSAGAVTSVIETVSDISEKRLLEEERLKTQKLESIGTLAGGIAHDFNNLLQGIFGYISMAKMIFDQKERALAMLEQAEQALHLSVNLTTQLLTFAKGGKPVKSRIDLQQVIDNSVKFALSGSRAEYHIKLDEGLWAVEADGGQIGQVIQNIVLNAEQAMPMGGTITITARNTSSRQKGFSSLLQQRNFVEISIKDSGIGIAEQYLPKIFDPYFTTKDKGSGLGLATSYSIIKNHGGLIDVKSKPGEGTTFFVYLPAVEAVEKSSVTSPENVRAVRKGRILLMDDDELIRNVAGVMLRSLGHEVELTRNGEEAIDKYRESMGSGGRYDIVIMDLTIRGGMGGEEAIKVLIEIDPDIKAVVSSGYSEDAAMSEFATYGFKARLTKPYKLENLNNTLNALFSA